MTGHQYSVISGHQYHMISGHQYNVISGHPYHMMSGHQYSVISGHQYSVISLNQPIRRSLVAAVFATSYSLVLLLEYMSALSYCGDAPAAGAPLLEPRGGEGRGSAPTLLLAHCFDSP